MGKEPTKVSQIILLNYTVLPFNLALVAGCGEGYEAKEFQNNFQCKTIGIDLLAINEEGDNIRIINGDITSLPFLDESFSVVYSYHVIEHIPDFRKALSEIHRVMKNNSVLYIGFPNRNRLLGYINSKSTITEKVKWNFNDLSMRLKGRFKNEYGAHAGFTQKEFNCILKSYFSDIYIIRNEYFKTKYSKYSFIINLIIKTGMAEFLFPSNYFICIKK